MKRNNMNNMKRILLLLLSLFVLANGMVGAYSGERIHHVFNEGDFLYWVEHADPGDEIEVCTSLEIHRLVVIPSKKDLTINTNIYHLTRSGSDPLFGSQMFYVSSGSVLRMKGNIRGSWNKSELGGWMHIAIGGVVHLKDVSFYDCSATKGGAIYNEGTLFLDKCYFKSNSAQEGGAIYNTQTGTVYFKDSGVMYGKSDSNGSALYNAGRAEFDIGSYIQYCSTPGRGSIYNAGRLTIAGGNYYENSSMDGGFLYNAAGATATILGGNYHTNSSTMYGGGAITNQGTLTVTGGTFRNNTSTGNGGGIYSNGTLNMEGKPVVTGNKRNGDANDVYLAEDRVLTVTGPFAEGATIGLRSPGFGMVLTSGYSAMNPSSAPDAFFFADHPEYKLDLVGGELVMAPAYETKDVEYIDLDGSQKTRTQVKSLLAMKYAGATRMLEGWYVADKNLTFSDRLEVSGDVNLILADGCTLTAPGGIDVPEESSLTIYGQSGRSGMVDINIDAACNNAGIGSSAGEGTGTITINGGVVHVIGGRECSAIGAGRDSGPSEVVFNGGMVVAVAGPNGYGIGAPDGVTHINWTNIADQISASFYQGMVIFDRPFLCGEEHFLGRIEDNSVLSGKTLTPDKGYSISLTTSGDGSAVVSQKEAYYGATITVNAAPKKNHSIESVSATGKSGADIALNKVDEQTFTFTMPSEPVTVNVVFRSDLDSIHYIDKNGRKQYVEVEYLDENSTWLEPGWYAVKGTVTNLNRISITGEKGVNIILCDDATLDNPKGMHIPQLSILYVWGQEKGTGTWSVTDPDSDNAGIGGDFGEVRSGSSCFYGGRINVSNAVNGAGIGGAYHGVGGITSFCGGTVTAESVNGAGIGAGSFLDDGPAQSSAFMMTVTGGDVTGISQNNDGIGGQMIQNIVILINFESPGSIYASSFGNANIALTTALTDGETEFPKNTTASQYDGLLDGKRLYPSAGTLLLHNAADNTKLIADSKNLKAQVVLKDRTLWKDGSWNTLCLPFAIEDIKGTPLDGATVKTLTGASFTNGKLKLSFSEPVTALEAGTPYIVKWNSGDPIIDPIFRMVTIQDGIHNVKAGDVTFTGCFGPVNLKADDRTVLYVGADNKLLSPHVKLDINSCRGYFVLGGGIKLNGAYNPAVDNQVNE